MINENVKRLLLEFNPFWNAPFKTEYRERSIFEEIKKYIPEKQIIALCGLRRVGKTTLLEKIIKDLIQTHSPTDVLFFSFEDHDFSLFDLIDTFKSMHNKEPRFLFFDEVQKLPNWSDKVKILYDTKKYKIFVSGSESLFLVKGVRESLAGRIYEFEVTPLNFSEYLQFTNREKLIEKPKLYARELLVEFKKYLLNYGFPEIIDKEDPELIRKYIRNAIIEKIIFKDMKKVFTIDNPAKIADILEIIIDNPGMLVDFTSLSKELGISRQTLSTYFGYLEAAHLVVKIYNYSRNRITSEKRLKKFYPAICSPALSAKKEDSYYSKLVESACVIKSGAKYFWRDKFKDEVDIILLNKNKDPIPIEVKYRDNPKVNKGVEKFCKKYKCNEATVVTRDERRTEQNNTKIEFVPVTEFLLKY